MCMDPRVGSMHGSMWSMHILTPLSTKGVRWFTGYCIYLRGNQVVWRSKRQSIYTQLSAKDSQFISIRVTKLLRLKILLKDSGITTKSPMKMFCENKIVINLSSNPVKHDSTKYVKIYHHFIKEKIDLKELILP